MNFLCHDCIHTFIHFLIHQNIHSIVPLCLHSLISYICIYAPVNQLIYHSNRIPYLLIHSPITQVTNLFIKTIIRSFIHISIQNWSSNQLINHNYKAKPFSNTCLLVSIILLIFQTKERQVLQFICRKKKKLTIFSLLQTTEQTSFWAKKGK